jgi:uncharacterized DUF497 family protein
MEGAGVPPRDIAPGHPGPSGSRPRASEPNGGARLPGPGGSGRGARRITPWRTWQRRRTARRIRAYSLTSTCTRSLWIQIVHTNTVDTPLKCAYTLAHESRLRPDQEREEHQGTPTLVPDIRKAYGETRYIALCYLDRRLHVLCFTETEAGIRVVSFRKANAREANRHGTPQTLD